MRLKSRASKLLCGLLASVMCFNTAMPSLTTFAVENTKPVNPDGTTPNWNKPQDTVSDNQGQYANQGVRLLVSKIKTSVDGHEGIAPKTTSAEQKNTVTYKISGRVEGTIPALEEKYGTGNIEFAYSSAGIYLGYGWFKGTYEYLLNRKAANYPEDLNFDIIYDGGIFSGFAYVTRKLATAEDENRFVAGATMALYEAIEIERDNTITNDGLDVGEDHRFIGVEVTRNSDGTVDDIRVKKGHAGTSQVYVYQKDNEDKLTVDTYGYVIDKNYNPQDQINDLKDGTWIMKSIEREDTPILYYNLDNLHITTNDVYTDTTVDKIFGSERVNKDSVLYGFDKERNVIDATQLNETDFSIYGFIGDNTKPSFEFVGGDFNEIKYSEKEKRIVVGKDTLIYHLDNDGNRDSLVDPQTGIAYIEETIDNQTGHDNIHDVNNTENATQKNSKIYVWPVNISYDGSGSTSGNKNGSKTFAKILGTRIATINADKSNEYTTGTYENGTFTHRLYPTLDLYGRTIYYKQSSETYVKGTDTWDYDGDIYTGWRYTDLLDRQNLDAYTINNHDKLYNGDADDPFDQSTHYQYSATQSIKLTVDSNGYIVNGSTTVPVPRKDGASFMGWILTDLTTLTDGQDIYPSWNSNPNKTMSDDIRNKWYSDRAATGTTRTVTVTFHANSKGDGDGGSAEFVSGSGDIHSTDNKLYRRLGDAYIMYDKWVSGENTPDDPFDTTLVDTVENTAANSNTLTAAGKTANDPYSDVMAGGMSDMLKRVALGDYIMEEVSAPLGYVKGLPVGVTVNYSSEVQRAEMEDKTIKVELVKVDAPDRNLTKYQYFADGTLQTNDGGNPVLKTEHKASFTYKEVTGAVFAITGTDAASKSALSSWAKVTSHERVTAKVGDDGYTYIEVGLDTPLVMEGFPKGNYLATEVKTPKGAVTMEPTAFSVAEEGSVQFKNFSDDHIKVEVEKYYLGSGDAITHLDNARRAELALVDNDGNIVSTWWTDDLSDYKKTGTSSSSLISSIISTFRSLISSSATETSFEEQFKTSFQANKKFTSLGWTVTRTAELLSGATDETQVWLLSDGTKVTCSYYSAPDSAPKAFKEAYKNVDKTVTAFEYSEDLTATKDETRSLTDSDMYWNCSNGSVIHIAAYPDDSTGKSYNYEFQYNYKDLSEYSTNLISYDKEAGVHRFDYLPEGTYKIRELTAPDGYIKADEKTINPVETSDIQRFMYENKRRDLTIAKYAYVNDAYYAGNDSGNALTTDDISKAAVIPGVKFEVYYSETQIPNYTTAFKDGNVPAGAVLKDTFITGKDGTYTEKDYKNFLIIYEKIGSYKPHQIKDVENGYYYTVEKTPLSGFATAEVKETIVTDSAADSTMNVDVTDKVLPMKLKVVKEDENGTRLSGAGFNITNKTLGGIKVGYVETNEMGEGSITIQNPYTYNADGSLKPYTFEIFETKAPGGYALTDKVYSFTADPSVTEDDGAVTLTTLTDGTATFVDTPTVISITKADFDSLSDVPGTGFTVYEASYDEASSTWSASNVTYDGWTWETHEGGAEHQLNNLAAGKTYALVETKVPAGYTLADTIFFTINNSGTSIEKTWTGNKDNHAITFNEGTDGAINSITFKSRQVLGATLIGKSLATGRTFETGLDNSGYITLTKTQLKEVGNYELTIKISYTDGTSDTIATTDIVATAEDSTMEVKLPVAVDKTNGISYKVTDTDGNEVAKWSLDSTFASSSASYTVANPLSGDDSSLDYAAVSGKNYIGQDSSAVYAKKQIAYTINYSGDGVNEPDIIIKPNSNVTVTYIDNQSAGAFGPEDDTYYHYKGSKNGGSVTFVTLVRKDAVGYVDQQVVVNGRTLERINPIAMNKDTDTTDWTKLIIANEVNGTDPANDDASFEYELTLTKNGTDNALSGEYDYRTKSTSGKFTSFGKVKTFNFTLKGNDFLVLELPSNAAYSVKQLSAEAGFATTTAGNTEGTVSTDKYVSSYATFKNERSVESDRTVFKKGTSYIVTESLALSDNEPRDITKYGFSLNDNDAAYNLIVLNKQTEVWFSKTAWTDCEEVPGASCTLYEQDASGNWIPAVINGQTISWTSGTEPTKFKGVLTAGKTYRYVEVGPPEGYAYTEAVEFTVSDDGRIDKVVMRDKLTNVKFTKTDFAGTEVPGAQVELKGYKVDGKPAERTTPGGTWESIDKWVSADDCVEHPHEIEGKLTPNATYRYHEEAAPDGYYYSEDIEFTLDSNGTVIDAHYINKDEDTIIYDAEGYPIDNITVETVEGVTSYYDGETLLTEKDGALYNGDAKAQGTDGFRVQIDVVNNVVQMKDGITKVTFTKKDFAGEEVEGAKVELKHYNKTTGAWDSVESWESKKTDETAGTSNEHVIEGKLNAGDTYRYHEEAAPEGYYYSEDIEFTLDNKGNVINAHYISNDGKNIIAYDSNGYPLEVVTVKEEEDGTRTFYYKGEKVTEDNGTLSKGGIVILEGVKVDIPVVNNVVQMLDAPIKVQLVKERAHTDGEIRLSGGIFQIVEKIGEKVIKDNFEIDKVIDLTAELEAGVPYLLREVTAPEGFKKAADVPFSVPTYYDPDNQPITVTMEDEREGAPSYEMDKVRVDDAPEKLATGTYGFYHGDTVSYKVTVKNTGDMVLTMTVADAFGYDDDSAETALLRSYFTKPKAADAVFYDYDKATDTKGAKNSAAGNTVRKNSDGSTVIQLNVGGMAEIVYTAKVLDTAPELLALNKADDKDSATDGYRNTAKVTDVTAKPENPKPGDKDSYNKDDFEELKDKKDTADTPVQKLIPGYTMDKVRKDDAKPKIGTDKFGFYRNSAVDYNVTVKNTGEMALELSVTDKFADDIAAYFSIPYVKEVKFYNADGTENSDMGSVLYHADPVKDNEGNELGNNKVRISLEVGGYAVVTYRATVANDAPENLSDAAVDDGLGYLNTATTTEVIGKYRDSKDEEHTVNGEKEYPVDPLDPSKGTYKPLGDQEDTANTPVQIPIEYSGSYTITKKRIDDATLKGGTENKYGFNRGDKVTYRVVVTNTGNIPIETYVTDQYEDSVKKYFNELQITDISFKVTADNSAGTGTVLTEAGTGKGYEKAKVRIPVGEYAELIYSAIVGDNAPENLASTAPDNGEGYLNIAKTEEPKGKIPPETPDGPETDVPLEPDDDKANTPVKVPVPGYTMEKVRVDDAKPKSGTTEYGFYKGDTVTYKVTVKNTGDMDLKMLVDDAFTEHAEYFSAPTVKSVKFFKSTDLEAQNNAYGAIEEREGTGTGKESVYISLKIGGTAEIYFTADVLDKAEEYLAPSAADDKEKSDDGYTNTASTKNVTGTYTDGNGEHTVTGDTEYPKNPDEPEGDKYKPLEDKEDTADTPVQVPKTLVPRYKLVKERTTDAPEKENGKYGFKMGDTVTYKVTISNTGDMPISTLVTDAFEESAKTYFENLKITDIKFLDKSGNASATAGHEIEDDGITSYIGSDKAYIYVYTGCTAEVTYTAKVSEKAIELLSDHPNEDDFGYINTAKATNSKGEPEDGGDKPPLEPKEDDEKTPVQTPEPSYTMEKVRVDDASPKTGTDKFGFKHGDVVTYKVTVRNTGAMQLTMDVDDNFDAAESAYFSLPQVTGADFYLADGTQSAAAGKKNSSDANKANITIEPGCYSIVTYTATVLDTAPEYLADKKADDKDIRTDGYGNTATTTNVTAKYTDGEGVEHTFTKDDFESTDPTKENPLKDKSDTADTPVQEHVNAPSYTLTKERVTPATLKIGEDGKYGFKQGEKVIYKIVVENTGETKLDTTISDEFDENIANYFKDLKIEAPEGGAAIVFTDRAGNANDTLGEVIAKDGTGIGTDKVCVRLMVGGRVEIYYSAYVSEKAEELLASAASSKDDPTGYVNIARTKDTNVPKEPDVPEYPELPDQEKKDHTPVQTPNPSYTMTKERITDAPEKADGKFGFKRGSAVQYKVTVNNTGDTTLTMDVTDKFNGTASTYFTTPLIENVTFTLGSFVETEGAGIGTDHATITLDKGGSAIFIYTAKVLDTAPESLALHAADDGFGYLNTATVNNVTSTYTDEGGNKHTTTKDDYPDDEENPLKPKDDTANTPVQVPTPDYAMEKTRVSEAPKKSSTKYGFYRGNSVTYEVAVTNTGTMDLEMLVNDAFDKNIAGYFEDLKITGVKFVDKATGAENSDLGKLLAKDGTGVGTTKAYISLNVGGKAIVTYTAKVSNTAKESLSNAAADDGLGYLNTATTSEVKGHYENGDGTTVTVTKDNFDALKDKSDTANTPVQVKTSGGGGGGGGGSDTYAKIVIYKYDQETSQALSGATFEIYYPDGSLYKTVTTGSTGEASVRIYQTGTFSYKEIKAPEGYELDSEVHELEVTNLATVTARVPNGTSDVPPVPPTPVPPTPETPEKGKITVSYNISVDGNGNGWFDSDGNYHKLPTPTKYKTGDDFNIALALIAILAGLSLVGIGVIGNKKRKKKQ